jgi:DNA-directed RNA polymerase subunit N (RpoN/RPB10)
MWSVATSKDVESMPDVPDRQSFQNAPERCHTCRHVVHKAYSEYKGYAVATTLPEYIVSYDFLHLKSFFHERRTTLNCQLLSLQNRLIKISLTIFWIATNGKPI